MNVVSCCGNCRFAKIVPQDMTKRYCNGVPPTPVAVPVPVRGAAGRPGGVEVRINMMSPVVEARMPGCALFQAALTVGVAPLVD